MTKYVAFLRGIGPINPNMRGEKLRAAFEAAGFTNVQTVLASGNVVFESQDNDQEAIAGRIEKALPEQLGFSSAAVVRSQAELQKLADQDLFAGYTHSKNLYLLVTFFRHSPPTLAFTLPHTPQGKPYTLLGKTDGAVYGKIDLTGGKTPDYMAWLERQFGKEITSRTPNTIRLVINKMNVPKP
jgi:uncharacterized protein (DUF1697 family)